MQRYYGRPMSAFLGANHASSGGYHPSHRLNLLGPVY
jgi:hypothetical protein